MSAAKAPNRVLPPVEAEAQRSEQALIAAGIEWTIVRCSWFAQNFSEAFMREAVLAGELADARAPGPGAVRRRRGHRRGRGRRAHRATATSVQVYELTGPRALRFDEAAAEIAAATGRPLRFTRLGVEQFKGGMLKGRRRRPTRPSSSRGYSRTCSTGATCTRRTVSSARSGAPRAELRRGSPARPPRPGRGHERERLTAHRIRVMR